MAAQGSEDESLGAPQRLIKTLEARLCFPCSLILNGARARPTLLMTSCEGDPTHAWRVRAERVRGPRPCTSFARSARRMQEAAGNERASRGGSWRCAASQEPRLSAATPTGWCGAVARAARRVCLHRQRDLEPAALSGQWARGRVPGPSGTSTPNVRGLVVGPLAQKAIETERGMPRMLKASPLPPHSSNRDPGWGLEASGAGVPTKQAPLVGCSLLNGTCPPRRGPDLRHRQPWD